MKFLPAENQTSALLDLNQEKQGYEINDGQWSSWYQHYHQVVLFPKERDFAWHVANGLNFNLQATSLCILASAAVVREVRHWWCILPAYFWLLLLIAEADASMRDVRDNWSTLNKQIIHLNEEDSS